MAFLRSVAILAALAFARDLRAEPDEDQPRDPPSERAALAEVLRGLPNLAGLDAAELNEETVSVAGRGRFRCPGTGHVVVASFDDAAPLACLLTESGQARCVHAPGARHARTREATTALCTPIRGDGGPANPVPPPAWIAKLAALFGDETPHRLLALEIFERGDAIRAHFMEDPLDERRYYVFVRGPAGWRVAEQPFGHCTYSSFGPWWAVDATPLVGAPAWALMASCAGSEQSFTNTLERTLRIVTERDAELRSVAEKRIGLQEWLRRDQDEHTIDWTKRPFVEVFLDFSLPADGTLRLRLARSSLAKLKRFCSRDEIAAGRAGESDDCPLPDLTDLRKQAGTWRLKDGGWIR